MSWSSFQNENLAIAEAIDSLYRHSIFSDFITVNVGGETKKVEAILLPIENIEDKVSGVFVIGGELVYRPVGISVHDAFVKQKYYMLKPDGVNQEMKWNAGRLFLPLEIVPDMLLSTTNGVDTLIYGLRSGERVVPLLFGCTRQNHTEVAIFGLLPYTKILRSFLWSHGSTVSHAKRCIEYVYDYGSDEHSDEHDDDEDSGDVESVLSDEDREKNENNSEEILDPKELVKFLDEYVVSQEYAKKVVSVAISNFCVRRKVNSTIIPKSNVILVGPTGVGKTLIVELLAKELSIPFYTTKLTGKTTSGYIGENVSDIFLRIRRDFPEDGAPHVIIFFDELDKLARDNWGGGKGFGSRIQQELVGWVESAIVGGLTDDNKKSLKPLSTENITFIFAGAFMGESGDGGVVDIIAKRLHVGQKSIGFQGDKSEKSLTKSPEQLLPLLIQDDLENYGIIPELVGRVPYITYLKPLTKEDLLLIMQDKKRSVVSQYRALLKVRGYNLTYTDDGLLCIAERCDIKYGARGLKKIFGDLFFNILYDPTQYANENMVITVDRSLVERELIKP